MAGGGGLRASPETTLCLFQDAELPAGITSTPLRSGWVPLQRLEVTGVAGSGGAALLIRWWEHSDLMRSDALSVFTVRMTQVKARSSQKNPKNLTPVLQANHVTVPLVTVYFQSRGLWSVTNCSDAF